MKVLVTGGAGFIGSHIVDELVCKGYEAVIVDNLSTGKKENINPKAKFYEQNIVDSSLIRVFTKEKPDYVIHQAAQVDVQASIKDPIFDAKVNILGFLNVLECCVKSNVKKIVCASSAAVYGKPKYLPIDENHPLNPESGYGLTKSVMSRYLGIYHQLYGLNYTVLRYSNVYGPRQDAGGEGGVVAIFINKLLSNKDLFIFGNGEQTRDFIFVKDAAHANIMALEKGDNAVLNISSKTQISIQGLFERIKYLTKKEKEPIYTESRKGDILHSCLDNTNAKKILHWEPVWSLDDGLRDTINYYINIYGGK
ncbi:UDP-glucose 4-epimerase [Desulfohalotomaculum tongense]|uniref:NAD-dependent epimerase/dehydratase family protein n=1 Tax=Desulforadius tongensis TaxID=1216062 RepID=UPI00195936CB|nr:NAD-dependent epimerase/dehydratase family protein [Desulforadius tongensis]MBM7853704.1 UDP-glucose 4-epimerase [Desulforadius tongensis]